MILLVSIILPTAANTLLKTGVSRISAQGAETGALNTAGIIGILISYIKSPLVVGGFFLYSIAALLWTYSLSKFDFSFANFATSLSYVVVLLVSLFIFKETISPIRWVGCGLILAGIFLMLKS